MVGERITGGEREIGFKGGGGEMSALDASGEYDFN